MSPFFTLDSVDTLTPSFDSCETPSSRRLARSVSRMRPLLRALGLAGVLVAGAGAHRVQAQITADTTMFTVTGTTNLYTMNRLTGALTLVTSGLSFNTSALARDPVTGRLYYVATNQAQPANDGKVAYYDPVTSTNVLLAAAANGDNVVRLAFDQSGVLYGIGSNSPTVLYQVNTSTGFMTALGAVKVGAADLGTSGDLAFAADGTLYATASPNGTSSTLYSIAMTPAGGPFAATATGTTIPTVQTSLSYGADGRLYSGGAGGNYYSIAAPGSAAVALTGGSTYYDFAISPRFADLSVTMSTPGVPSGGTATYTISVKNSGPQSANGQITVVDSLPAGLTYASTAGGWTCAAVGQRVTCTTPGPLANGATSTFTLSATVAATVTVGSTVTNIARVTGSTVDQDQTDNRVTLATVATRNVILTITKSHVGNFLVGTNGTYTLTAKNTGTSASSGTITFTDTLPSGMQLVSFTGYACLTAGTAPQVVTCTYASAVAINATITGTLTVSVAAAAVPAVTNRAWASGGGTLAPSSASDPTTVNQYLVDVTPVGSAVSQLPSNGTNYTGAYTVKNTGTLSDTYTLSALKAPGTSLAIVSVNGVAGTGGSITLAAGASVSIPVVYTVVNAAVTGAVDSLRLRALSSASATLMDTGSYVITVVRAGISIVKQLYRNDQTTLITPSDIVAPGELVQFKIVVTGTGAASNSAVKVTDPIPGAVTYIAATGDIAGWSFAISGSSFTANLAGTLANGTSRYFWIQVKVQ